MTRDLDTIEQAADPFAHGESLYRFGATYLRPGLHYRRRRVVPVSLWILRPRYSWRTRNV